MFHTRTHKKGLLASSDLIEHSVPGAFSDHFSRSELINSTVCLRCRYLPLCVRWHPYGSEQTDLSGHQARGWPTAPPQHRGGAEQQGPGWEPLLGPVTQVTTASWDTRRNTSTTQPHAEAHSLCSSRVGLKLHPAFCPLPSVCTKNCWFSAMLWTLLCPTRREVIFICIKTHQFYQRLGKEVKDCQERWKSVLAAGSCTRFSWRRAELLKHVSTILLHKLCIKSEPSPKCTGSLQKIAQLSLWWEEPAQWSEEQTSKPRI